jgi:L-threonylcarbamoyladenylate synthase
MVRVVKADVDGLIAASGIVAKGGIIAYPTDTVYGLGCNPFDQNAVRKLIAVKGQRRKPLPVLVKTLTDAEKVADLSEKAVILAGHYWPGPLTLVLKAKERVPALLAPEGSIGVRSPRHSTCLGLLGLCSGHLVGTSANKTGAAPATTAGEVVKGLGDQIDLVVDGGKTTLGVASTVVDARNSLVMLREGPISKEELLKCLRARK